MADAQRRAYAQLHVKELNAERRTISGVATTPTPDRVGDIIDPSGVTFQNPVSLLLHHDKTQPVGLVTFSRPTKDGVKFSATFPTIEEPGPLHDRIEEAWQSVKSRLIRGVSIGFRVLDDAVELIQQTGGLIFKKTELLELSLVSVPANVDATIDAIKQYDSEQAAIGRPAVSSQNPAGASAPVVRVAQKGARAMAKTIQEQIQSYEDSRREKATRRSEIMTKASDEGNTLDATATEEYDTLTTEIKSIDEHVKRLKVLDEENKAAAVAVAGNGTAAAAASRGGDVPVIRMKQNLPPGIAFARAVLCKAAAFLEFHKGNFIPASDIAKSRYPDHPEIAMYLKTNVAAGTTTDATWAAPLFNDTTLLANDFLEFFRAKTIVGKFGTGNIPSLRRVPFNVRIAAQTVGGSASWVGQGKAKPVTKFGYESSTMLHTKIAAIAVITEELARFSTPSAETLVRDQLAEVVIERMDQDFIDPAISAISGVRPASITNGVTPLTTAGTSAANVLTDLQNLIEPFLLAKVPTGSIVLIMPETLAMVLSLQLNALGQRAFPTLETGGGTLAGFPVITTQYAANEGSYGNMVIAVNARDIALADDGQVTVDASREAAIEMSDAPANESVTPTASSYMVSMYQSNSIALRAERFVNWKKLRSNAVVLFDDVNWGSIGSPV